MIRFRWAGVWAAGLVWLAIGVGCTNAADGGEKPSKAETVVIPLDQIWALDMPGTRDVRELQADKLPPLTDGQLVAQIRRSLSKDRPKGEAARASFAVPGTGLEALREAHAVLVEGKKPRKSFPVNSDLSLVFFSQRLLGYYVHVCEVVQEKNDISIRYRFVPHRTKEMTTHFALISVSGLQPGKVQVNVIRSPMEEKYIVGGRKPTSAEEERRVVCKSFSFAIADTPASDSELGKPQTEKSESISLSSIITTSPQSGMLHTKELFSPNDHNQDAVSTNGYLRKILQDSRGGASIAFLVDAVNASSAIAASFSVFVGSRSVGAPVPSNKPDPPRGNHWLVVYLGVGPSTPTWWKVEEANVEGNAITLSYRKAPPSPATADVHPYYYWVPLGSLAPGTYEVNLFDTDLCETTLMRRVGVLSPIGKRNTP